MTAAASASGSPSASASGSPSASASGSPSGSAAAPDPNQTASLHEAMPLMKTLGIDVITNTAAEVRARLAWSAGLCTSGGLLHGGAIMALADSTGGACAFLNLPEGAAGTSTIESKTNFLRGVRDGYIESVSRPLHTGRTVIVIETDVVDAAGRLVARVTQSQAVLRAG